MSSAARSLRPLARTRSVIIDPLKRKLCEAQLPFLSLAGKQRGGDVPDLRPDEESRRDAQGRTGPELLAQGVRVVEEDEVSLALPKICEVPGAQIPGEKYGRKEGGASADARKTSEWSVN